MTLRVSTNHWGWTLRGVRVWLRCGWSWPVSIWGVEVGGSDFDGGREFQRRIRIGPISFNAGRYRKVAA